VRRTPCPFGLFSARNSRLVHRYCPSSALRRPSWEDHASSQSRLVNIRMPVSVRPATSRTCSAMSFPVEHEFINSPRLALVEMLKRRNQLGVALPALGDCRRNRDPSSIRRSSGLKTLVQTGTPSAGRTAHCAHITFMPITMTPRHLDWTTRIAKIGSWYNDHWTILVIDRLTLHTPTIVRAYRKG
jgi:hypothetical protein